MVTFLFFIFIPFYRGDAALDETYAEYTQYENYTRDIPPPPKKKKIKRGI